MANMNITGGSTVASEVPSVNGIKPVASQVSRHRLQALKIQARR